MHSQAVIEAFDLLGVSPQADAKAIRQAWRALVRTYHPDQFRGDKDAANRRLAELNAAFDLVTAAAPVSREGAKAQSTRASSARKAQAQARADVQAQQHAAEQRRRAQMRAQRDQNRQDAKAAARRRAAELDRRDAEREAARRKATRPVRALSAAEMRASQAAQNLFQDARRAFAPAVQPRVVHAA
ncbi:J domain-containing protein [Gymnodinialimonas sp. 2305UL16-5]|uniref:J domain-containing protein n=1 Tax=Gymnodinialimonas mytili TaxID=3126503 RepID=UPI0030995A03